MWMMWLVREEIKEGPATFAMGGEGTIGMMHVA